MQRVRDLNLNRFGVNAHSSHRFGLSAQTAPALTRRLQAIFEKSNSLWCETWKILQRDFGESKSDDSRGTLMRMTFASLFTILFAFTSAFAGTDTAKKLVGEWKGTDETGEQASLVFHEDGSAAMLQT